MKTKDSKNLIEGNKLIAEFMGGKEVDWWAERTVIMPHKHQAHLGFPPIMNKANHTNWGKALILDVEIKYHKDWNWIMSAYLKAKAEIKSKLLKNLVDNKGYNRVSEAGELILEGKCLEAQQKLVEAIEWQIKNKDK